MPSTLSLLSNCLCVSTSRPTGGSYRPLRAPGHDDRNERSRWAEIRTQAAAPPPPTAPAPARNDFRCGEKVSFEDKYPQTVVGTIVRINDRTATVDPGDGTKWRVGFPLLRHVFDV